MFTKIFKLVHLHEFGREHQIQENCPALISHHAINLRVCNISEGCPGLPQSWKKETDDFVLRQHLVGGIVGIILEEILYLKSISPIMDMDIQGAKPTHKTIQVVVVREISLWIVTVNKFNQVKISRLKCCLELFLDILKTFG